MWMVRAGKNSILIDEFEKLNIVAIGWGLGDLTNKTPDEIKELVNRHYPDESNQTKVKYAANEIKFRHDIKEEDYVLSYNSWNRYYLFGKIISDYYFDPNLINEEYSDVRDVEWLCKVPKDNLKQSTQNTLGTRITVFRIKDEECEDILMNIEKEDIKQIRTVTLADSDSDSLTYDDAINFLSNVLMNERDGHFHYIRKNVNLIGRTLVLFKYKGKLIAKGIFIDEVAEKVSIKNENYNGYYLVEKNSIAIFREPISLADFNKYVRNIKSLSRDVIIDLKYLDNVNQMIEDYTEDDSMTDEYDNSAKIIRDYLDENNLGNLNNQELEKISIKFRQEFGPDILENLEGIDIINKIFSHDGDKSTLCYNLEYSQEYMRGGIGGGSAYKFSLFKRSNTGQWMCGSSQKHKSLTEQEAIEVGSKIRDALVNGAKHIENTILNSIEDFASLEDDLNEIFSDCIVKSTASWVHKYFVLLFPEKFLEIHAKSMKIDFLNKFRIEPLDGYYENDGQFFELAKKSGVKLYSLLDDRIVKLFFESDNKWKPIDEGGLTDLDPKPFESDLKRDIIYFGAPGTGKSYNLNKDKEELLENFEDNYERVTFHPDYSYANFVGTYKPVPDGDSITYDYVPGPFMRILKKALNKPNKPFMLIIEEINRANVAAVFGDVFQLLDRDENYESEYAIETSEDMRRYLNRDKIKIPQNLFIWATMNSADQGVFPMDTAFKRRWDFKYFSINHNENLIEDTHVVINDKLLYWNNLRKRINDELLSYKINEDKLIGPFFAFNEFMNQKIPEDIFKDIFKNKIIMYLFEDAARSRRNQLFSGACNIKDTKNITYFELCELIDDDKITEIFSNDFLEETDNE